MKKGTLVKTLVDRDGAGSKTRICDIPRGTQGVVFMNLSCSGDIWVRFPNRQCNKYKLDEVEKI